MEEKEAGAAFARRVYELVGAIPRGKVASYGQLALLAGFPRWARRAGRVLRQAPPGLPCHRVVNSIGRTAPGWPAQQELLRAEGVSFGPGGRVRMKSHRWQAEGRL